MLTNINLSMNQNCFSQIRNCIKESMSRILKLFILTDISLPTKKVLSLKALGQ
jgi:hypothetical protein